MATAGSTRINIDLALNTKGFRPLGRINGQLGEFEKSLDASNARVLAFGASAGAILAVKKAFTATVKAAIEVQKSLKDINVILQATSGNLKKFGSELFKIASDTGQAFSVAAEAATELARQGLGTVETLKRTRDALILARLSGLDAAAAVNALTAALNTFTRVGLDSTAIINKLANVDAAFAVSSEDLAKALGRVGSAAVAAGVDLDQLLAIVTTAQQKTARGGAVIGNSFKTIFTRIQRPRVIKQLESLGVAVKGLEGEALPAMKVLQNLAKQFDNLSQSQRAQISELVGGVFQVNILKAALSDLSREQSIYNRALGISIGSSDQAIRRNEELNQTLAAQFQKTLNTFKEAAAELGTLTLAPAMENIFGAINKTFESAAGDGDLAKTGQLIGKSVFQAIGKFIGGPGLIIVGGVLFKTFATLATFAADAFKTLTGLNKNFQTQLNLQKQIFNVLSENPDLMQKIKNGTLGVEDAHELVLNKINQETGALERQLQVSNAIASSLTKSGVGYSADFGATSGGTRKFGRRPKGKSGGFVPNFTRDDEVMGMMMGGYSGAQLANPKVRRDTIHNGRGGAFSAFTNGHEKVVDFTNSKGKKATAVIPPRGTSAHDDFIGALSGGYVPNFASVSAVTSKIMAGKNPTGWNNMNLAPATIAQAKKNSAARKKKAGPKKKIVHPSFDAGKQYGMLGLYGNTDKAATITASTKDITRLKNRKGVPSAVQFSNFSQKSFEGGMKKQKTSFGSLIKKHMAKPMERLSNDFAQQMGLRDDAPKVTSTNIGRRGNSLLPPGAEGAIFETSINALTKNAKSFEAGLAGDTSALWDFEESGNVDKNFKRKFGFSSGLKRADAKRSFSKEAINSIGNKMFSSLLNPDGSPVHRGNRLAVKMSDFAQNYPTIAKKKGKSGGYIPNFSALHNAVMREKSAGVPSNRIRVGSSPSLASGMNPMGLGVWNTRDEPRGLSQGISRSFASGANPKRAGIPNFAEDMSAADKKADRAMNKSTAQMMKMSAIMMGLSTGISLLRNSVDTETSENHKLVSGLGALESAVMTVMMGGMMGGMFPKLDAMGKKSLSMPFGRGAPGPRAMHSSTAAMPTSYLGPGSGRISDPGRKGATRGWSNQKAGWFSRGGSYLQGASQIGGAGGGSTRMPSQFVSTPSRVGGAIGATGRGIASGGRALGRGAMSMGRGIKSGAAGMGPLGVAAVGVAAYQGISTLANETFNSSFNEMKDASSAFKKVSEEAEKNIGALTKFGDSAEQASKVFHDSNATMGQVMQAQKEMAKAAQDLPANIRTQIQSMVDPRQIQAAVQRGVEQQQDAKRNAQTRVDVATATREIRKSDFSLTGTGLFDSAATAKRKEAQDLRTTRSVGRTALSTINDQDINALGTGKLLNATEALSRADSSEKSIREVEGALQGVGLDPMVIDSLTKAMEEGDYAARQMAQGVLDELLQRRKLAQEDKAMAPVREALIKKTREATMAIQEQKDALQLEQKIRKETIKISSQAAGAFLNATGKIELGARSKIAAQLQGSSAKFGSSLSATNKAFGGTQLAGTALGQQVQQTLSAAQAGGVGSMNTQAVEAQTEQLRAAAEQASGAEKSALENLASQLEALNGTSRLLFKENQKQVYETRAIAMAQKAAARQQQRLKSFGGSKAILDPSSLNGVINQITSGEMAMGVGARAGSSTGFHRGNANRLAGMQELLGGKLPERMVEQGRRSAAQAKLADIRVMNKRFGMNMSEKEMRSTAKEQAAELFKSGNPIDRNNKGLESLNGTMLQLNNLLGAAQNNRIAVGSMEQQAAMQASQGEQWMNQNQGDIRRGAGREFAGLQGYGGSVSNMKGRMDQGYYRSMYGMGELQGDQAGMQRNRQNAARLSQSNQNNNTTNVYVNGINMQGDREQQRRMMQMMQYAGKYDPRLRQAIAQGNIPAGQGY